MAAGQFSIPLDKAYRTVKETRSHSIKMLIEFNRNALSNISLINRRIIGQTVRIVTSLTTASSTQSNIALDFHSVLIYCSLDNNFFFWISFHFKSMDITISIEHCACLRVKTFDNSNDHRYCHWMVTILFKVYISSFRLALCARIHARWYDLDKFVYLLWLQAKFSNSTNRSDHPPNWYGSFVIHAWIVRSCGK